MKTTFLSVLLVLGTTWVTKAAQTVEVEITIYQPRPPMIVHKAESKPAPQQVQVNQVNNNITNVTNITIFTNVVAPPAPVLTHNFQSDEYRPAQYAPQYTVPPAPVVVQQPVIIEPAPVYSYPPPVTYSYPSVGIGVGFGYGYGGGYSYGYNGGYGYGAYTFVPSARYERQYIRDTWHNYGLGDRGRGGHYSSPSQRPGNYHGYSGGRGHGGRR